MMYLSMPDFYRKPCAHLQEILYQMESVWVFVIVIFRWAVSPGLPLLWGGEGWDRYAAPSRTRLPEIKDGETIKDKRIKQMKRWKEVITASPAESFIRSDRIFRNAQHLGKTWCVSLPSNCWLWVWRRSLSAPLHSGWPMHFHEPHTGQVTMWEAHLRPLEYSVT